MSLIIIYSVYLKKFLDFIYYFYYKYYIIIIIILLDMKLRAYQVSDT